jgi:glycosyltransferase involved in cell wall biosynthesis
MKTRPRISVIMSVYNAEKYLAESIESILGQTYRDFEFIIINDGSTDNSANIIKTYKDTRIKYFYQKNQGLSVALNFGIGRAKGKYIARMDADDISLPQRFEKQLDFMDEYSDIGLLGTNIEVIDKDNAFRSVISLLTQPDDLKFGEVFCNQVAHGTVFIRREILKKSGLYDSSMEPAEDADLWRRISHYTKMANLKEPLYRYREHGAGVTQKIDRVHEAALRTAKREFEYYLQNPNEYKIFSFHPTSMWGGIYAYLKRKGSLYRCLSMMYYSRDRQYSFAILILALLHTPWVSNNYSQLFSIIRSSKKWN